MIAVFKTNVQNSIQAKPLIALLNQIIPSTEVNFDLEDCDNVLRVKGEKFCAVNIIQILKNSGFECQLLK